jgi:hypothetical protein
MTTSVCRRKFQVQAQQEKDNFYVIGLPWHNVGFLLEVKLTKWCEAGCAQGVRLSAAADPSCYEAGPNFGWGWGGQADTMLCVEPQSTKVRGVEVLTQTASTKLETKKMSKISRLVRFYVG